MECSTFVFQVICLALIVRSGESIKCHVCDSVQKSQCGESFNTDNSLQPVDCTPEYLKKTSEVIDSVKNKLKDFIDSSSVLKNIGLDAKLYEVEDATKAVCQKITIQLKDSTTTIRGCTMPKSSTIDTCAAYEKSLEGSQTSKVTFCDYCDKDGCNGASGVAPGSLLVSLFAALSLAAILKAY